GAGGSGRHEKALACPFAMFCSNHAYDGSRLCPTDLASDSVTVSCLREKKERGSPAPLQREKIANQERIYNLHWRLLSLRVLVFVELKFTQAGWKPSLLSNQTRGEGLLNSI